MRAVWESAAGAWEDYDVDAVGERGPGSSGSISWWSSISPGVLTWALADCAPLADSRPRG